MLMITVWQVVTFESRPDFTPSWTDFGFAQSADIEQAFTQGQATLTLSEFYIIHFGEELCQENVQSGARRPIRRIITTARSIPRASWP
jgi:hypothetical protein